MPNPHNFVVIDAPRCHFKPLWYFVFFNNKGVVANCRKWIGHSIEQPFSVVLNQ